MENAFAKNFLTMFDTPVMPDRQMRAEKEGVIDRYVGDGEEPFYYSLRLNAACDKAAFEQIVRNEIALAKKRNRSFFEWKEYALPALPFMADVLTRRGFHLARESRLLFTAVGTPFPQSPSVEVKEVTDEASFEILLDINQAAFGGERSAWLHKSLLPEIKEGSKIVRAFVAYVDGKPASSAWVKIYSKIAFLFGGGTVPTLRGRGAYRALVEARSEFAKEAGAKFVLSECSPASEKVLRALSFTDAGKAYQWIHASI